MRQGQQNRRGRGRSNNSNNNSGSNHNHNNGRKPQNPLSRNYESSGPDVKIRGTAAHIAEKYMALARDAASSGDFVTAENYLQHAEHYNRIIMAAQAQSVPQQPYQSGGEHSPGFNGQQRPQLEPHMAMRDQPQPVISEQPPMVSAPGREPQPAISDEALEPNGLHNGSPQSAAERDADGGRRRRRRYPASPTNRAGNAPSGESTAPANGSANGLDGPAEGHSSDEAVAN